jgi:hypothetical protein
MQVSGVAGVDPRVFACLDDLGDDDVASAQDREDRVGGDGLRETPQHRIQVRCDRQAADERIPPGSDFASETVATRAVLAFGVPVGSQRIEDMVDRADVAARGGSNLAWRGAPPRLGDVIQDTERTSNTSK